MKNISSHNHSLHYIVIGVVVILFLTTIVMASFLMDANKQIQELSKRVDDLNTSNQSLSADLKLSVNGGKKLTTYSDTKYNFSMEYPDTWTVKNEVIPAEKCGHEVLNEDSSGTGTYEGECEEILFYQGNNVVLNFVVSNNENTNTNFSYRGIPAFIIDQKISDAIQMQGISVNRYNLTDPDGVLIGYSYNQDSTSQIEAEDFTGKIHIKDLYFGAYTNTTDSLSEVEKVLESIIVN